MVSLHCSHTPLPPSLLSLSKQARKRLTSRSTRYSGVLDMLNLEEGDPHDLGVLEVREGGREGGKGEKAYCWRKQIHL